MDAGQLEQAHLPVRPDVIQSESFMGNPATALAGPILEGLGPMVARSVTAPVLKNAGRALTAAGKVTGTTAKLAPKVGGWLSEAGAESAGAMAPSGQSALRGVAKSLAQGSVQGTVLSAPFAAAAQSPEEAGQALGGGFGFGGLAGGASGLFSRRPPPGPSSPGGYYSFGARGEPPNSPKSFSFEGRPALANEGADATSGSLPTPGAGTRPNFSFDERSAPAIDGEEGPGGVAARIKIDLDKEKLPVSAAKLGKIEEALRTEGLLPADFKIRFVTRNDPTLTLVGAAGYEKGPVQAHGTVPGVNWLSAGPGWRLLDVSRNINGQIIVALDGRLVRTPNLLRQVVRHEIAEAQVLLPSHGRIMTAQQAMDLANRAHAAGVAAEDK
jgi:hypothetical protein